MQKILAAICLALFVAACGTTNTTSSNTPAASTEATPSPDVSAKADLEIAGTWASDFGGNETISNETWKTDFASASVISFDNETNTAILQNATDDAYNPSKFNRVVWTETDNKAFFYCWEVLGMDTAEEAETDATVSDDADPANSGCGGFSWTRLSQP